MIYKFKTKIIVFFCKENRVDLLNNMAGTLVQRDNRRRFSRNIHPENDFEYLERLETIEIGHNCVHNVRQFVPFSVKGSKNFRPCIKRCVLIKHVLINQERNDQWQSQNVIQFRLIF